MFIFLPSGVYKDCEIEFSMELRNYPFKVPILTPKSKIIHPNIDYDSCNTGVCLNLFSDWESYEGMVSPRRKSNYSPTQIFLHLLAERFLHIMFKRS